MTKQTKNYEIIKELIHDFLNENLNVDEVLNRWPNEENDMSKQEGYLVHRLLHFQTDWDIHKKDPGYEKYEREAIKELFDRLE